MRNMRWTKRVGGGQGALVRSCCSLPTHKAAPHWQGVTGMGCSFSATACTQSLSSYCQRSSVARLACSATSQRVTSGMHSADPKSPHMW